MNYVSMGMGILLILATWWLWRTFEDVRVRGPNPDPKGKL